MENLYILFEVTVNEQQHWGGKRASTRCEIAIPREVLGEFDPGNIFASCLKAALIEYDKAEENEN